MDEERLEDLLLCWEEQTVAGQEVSATELCRDCPHLTEELQQRIDALRRVGWLTRAAEPAAVASRFTFLAAGAEPVTGYRLVERLGRGGFAEVWKADGPDGPVALKLILQEDKAARQEWRSLEVMRLLHHPHLLPIHAAWHVDGFLIVAMQLADGTLLERWQQTRAEGLPGIPRDELLRYFREAAEGIDFLQKRYLQHRDVKPQNLLLVGGRVKVADFGLTRVLTNSVTGHTGSLTLAYAAPEFFEGKTTRQSDQYSLAVTWCQLRTGKLPFEGTPAAMVAAHLGRPPDLALLPAEERPAVARALAKRADERWPTCRAFVEALADPRPEPPPSSGQAVRWHRMKWLGLLAVVALLAVGLVLLSPRRVPTASVRSFEQVENAHYIRSAAANGLLFPSGDGVVVLSNGSGKPILWDGQTGKPLLVLPYRGGPCAAVANYQNPLGVTGHDDGAVILWDLETGKEVRRLEGHTRSVSSVAFSLDNRHVLSGGCDRTLRWWDTKTGEQIHCLRGHQHFVMSAAVDPTGRHALSGSFDGTVRLWDLETGREVKRLEGHQSLVWTVAFSPDGRLAASGGQDRTIRIWDLEAGQETARFEAHSESVSALCFLQHHRLAVADGNEVRFLELPDGKEWLRCPAQPSLVQSLSFTALQDQIYLVLGTAKDGVRVCIIPQAIVTAP